MKAFIYLTLTVAFLGGLLPGCKKQPVKPKIKHPLFYGNRIYNTDSLGNWSKVREQIISDELDKLEGK